MKSAFVATAFKQRHMMQAVLDIISEELSTHGYTPLVFVQRYQFEPNETQQMMEMSRQHIADCDLFIAELTHKVVGVGIEAGYAHAYHKPIVYIRHANADPSTTLTGIARYHIVYADSQDLREQLHTLLNNL